MSDFGPIWDLREKKYQVRGFFQSFIVYHGRGQKFTVCKTKKSLISISASPRWLQGCNARDIRASSSTGNTGFCCPVIKGQSLNGDEQSCNERLGRHCVSGDSCFVGDAAGPPLARAASLCPAPGAPEASLPFRGSAGRDTTVSLLVAQLCVTRTNPTFPLFACLDKQPCFMKVRAFRSLRCLS